MSSQWGVDLETCRIDRAGTWSEQTERELGLIVAVESGKRLLRQIAGGYIAKTDEFETEALARLQSAKAAAVATGRQ